MKSRTNMEASIYVSIGSRFGNGSWLVEVTKEEYKTSNDLIEELSITIPPTGKLNVYYIFQEGLNYTKFAICVPKNENINNLFDEISSMSLLECGLFEVTGSTMAYRDKGYHRPFRAKREELQNYDTNDRLYGCLAVDENGKMIYSAIF